MKIPSKHVECALKNNVIDMSSDAFQERHNQFIDSIFTRINRIVADNYDPFVVRLNARPALKEANRNAPVGDGQSTTKKTPPQSGKAKTNASKSSSATVPIKKLKNTKSEPRTLMAADGRKLKESTIAVSPDAIAKVQTKLQQLQDLKPTEQSNDANPNKMISASHSDAVNGEVDVDVDADVDVDVDGENDDDDVIPADGEDEGIEMKFDVSTVPVNDPKSTSTSTSGEGVGVGAAAALASTEESISEVRTAFVGDSAKSNNQKKFSTKANNSNNNNKKQNGKKATTTVVTSTAHTIVNINSNSIKTNTNNNKNNKIRNQKLKQTNNNAIQKGGKDVEKLQKAEGSLSGLASLKRVGNVKMVADPEGRNSTIKAKFTLGPLMLRVEKSFKRGSVRNVKSATARTNEMIGRIKFSVVNDRAMLMSIKVQQPKQVEIESKSNHDRTRDFIWRRTPKLAKLVNEKLKLAAESLFTPQGVEVVRL